MANYRLLSTPGLVAWGINHFPRAAAKALLSGAVPFTVAFTYPSPRLTQAAELAAVGVTFRRTDFGEFRVNLKGGTESTAAYESDVEAARDAETSIPYRPFFPPTGARKAAALHGLDSFRHGCRA